MADEKLSTAGENASAKTAAKKPQRQAAPRKKQAFMYLGPNVPGGILFTGSVYKELPEHLKGVFEKAPEVKELFVEVKDVPAFKAKLGQQGSEPYRLHQAVERLINEGVLNSGRV